MVWWKVNKFRNKMKKPHHAKTTVIQCQLGTYLCKYVVKLNSTMGELVCQSLVFDEIILDIRS